MTDTQAPVEETTPTPTPPPKKPKKRRGWKLLFILLLSGIAGGASFLSYQLWLKLEQNQKSLHSKTIDIENKVGELVAKVEQLQNQDNTPEILPALQQQLDAVQQKNIALNTALQGVYQRLRQISDNETHSLNEVSALLYIANQHLLLARDVSAALSALEAADLRLKEFQSPDLLAVRRQLRADITQLASLEQADIVGISLQLSTYSEQVQQWPLLQGQQQQRTDKPTESNPIDVTDWQQLSQAVWQQLRQLVVIRHNEQAEQGLLSASQRALLSQTLQAKLEITRLQLQRHDQANFRLELQSIIDLIKTYYDTNDSQIKAVQAALNTLQQANLSPQLPDISKTLALLQQRGKQETQAPLPVATPTEVEAPETPQGDDE